MIIKINKVVAWQSQDGSLFLDRDEAFKYDTKTAKERHRKETIKEKSDSIKDYGFKKMKDQDVILEDLSMPFYEGEWGWFCDHKDNPIDKCVYIHNRKGYWDECCIYCGEPEERK